MLYFRFILIEKNCTKIVIVRKITKRLINNQLNNIWININYAKYKYKKNYGLLNFVTCK